MGRGKTSLEGRAAQWVGLVMWDGLARAVERVGQDGAQVELLTKVEHLMNSAGRLQHPLIILHSSDSTE